jgi:DNA helicase-2/ATP-dependent DNA helicase PcrA
MEEERRLCYVGITRAKQKLYLTFAEKRITREGYSSQLPSRFLGEIPQEICDYYSFNNY